MIKKKRLLTPAEKKKIKSILKKELTGHKEIIFAYLHGSFVLPVPCGDVDVAVYLEETALPQKHWDYEGNLEAPLERLVSMPIDVQILNCAPIALRYHATCGKVLLSKNELTRYTFLEKTWREYFDYQPLFRAYLHDLLDDGQDEHASMARGNG
ncbi:predicted nucleotidyltransferases [Pelotomaculum thermopropionicum SI]|uniref:Predicted nucleotidyltransferases n=1 Tax=Pelotomaculum thermopropionicum (strain DSM 13744 / JCM 10971 / SI) TaxID=370438 RepID=A5D0G7_PELTS|nr:predicted nucleotidyltransferases [Pelotomaculum thermopropionicum SI]